MNLDQMAQQSYQQNQQLQNMYNTDATNATNQYNSAVGNANQTQSDLQNFTKNMQSGTDMYNNALQKSNANAGYNVGDLNSAQGQVSQIQGIMGGLPRAVQAQNANYGATAGDVAGQYSTEAGNLNQSLQLANQNASNQIQKMQGGLSGAQSATTAGLQGQDQQRQAYAASAANATAVMQNSEATMNDMIKNQMQNGNLSASEQNMFAQAKANYAAAQQSLAQAQAAIANAGLYNAQTTGQNQKNMADLTTYNQNQADLARKTAEQQQFNSPAASMARSRADMAASQESAQQARYNPFAGIANFVMGRNVF